MCDILPLIEHLRIVGEAIHGDGWRRAIARDLGTWHPRGGRDQIDDRLVRRWISGERPVPAWVGEVLPKVLALAKYLADCRMDDAAKTLGYPGLSAIVFGMAIGNACVAPSAAAKKRATTRKAAAVD